MEYPFSFLTLTEGIIERLNAVEQQLEDLIAKVTAQEATLSSVVATVAANDASTKVLIANLKSQLAAQAIPQSALDALSALETKLAGDSATLQGLIPTPPPTDSTTPPALVDANAPLAPTEGAA